MYEIFSELGFRRYKYGGDINSVHVTDLPSCTQSRTTETSSHSLI